MTLHPESFVWTKTVGFEKLSHEDCEEQWSCTDRGSRTETFKVKVKKGKSLDVRSLKNVSLAEIREYATFLRGEASRLYSGTNCLPVSHCPCCGSATEHFTEAVRIFDVPYLRCSLCSHVFVGRQAAGAVMNETFTESEEHSSTYTDKAAVEVRLAQVIQPKLAWVRAMYRELRGREPRSVLDVGAGAGHFVEGCRREKIEARGIELSNSSRRFAKEVFGFELEKRDFLTDRITDYAPDVITFWGLLEYVQHPLEFIEAAKKQLAPGGILVVEIPRFECLSSAVQAIFPHSVARHLDPSSHINCFSDSSLLTALHRNGFKPKAAWYFGMDAYELLCQLSLNGEGIDLLSSFADIIPSLQGWLDRGVLCDDLVLISALT